MKRAEFDLNNASSVNFKKNVLIMALPGLLPAVPILIEFGESAILFAVPLIISFCLIGVLANRLNTKDAIAYPVVQYAFFVLLFYLLAAYGNVGLALIAVLPMIFIINFALVFSYFMLVKNKRLRGKVIVLLLTILITLTLYSEHYGVYARIPMIVRLWNGLFG